MQMIHGLAAMLGRVDDYAIAPGKPVLAGQVGRDPQKMTEQGRMLLAGVGQGSQMFPGHDQKMDRRLGMDIGKGIASVVLVDGLGRDASFDDPAEDAARHGTSVQELVLT